MNKILKLLVVVGSFFLFVGTADAATASIAVKSNYSQVVVGNTVTVTVTVSSASPLGAWEFDLNYNSSVFTYKSGSLNVADYISNDNTKSRTYTYTFTAKNSGSGTFSVSNVVVMDFDVQKMQVSTSSKTVSVITREQLEASYSKINDLKDIEVVGYELDQVFDEDILEYNVSVPEGTEMIELIATREDSKSSVAGAGELEVSYGLNKFELIVTAQNGSTKTYIVNVTVEDKNPISIKIGDGNYTIVKDKRALVPPTTYIESTVLIDGIEVPALYGDLLKYTLVGLKDEAGNIVLAVYDADKNTYELYTELVFNTFSVIPKPYTGELEDYELKSVKINDKMIDVYVKEGSDFYLIYGINALTGEENLYKYDSVENTIQRYEEGSASSEELRIYKIATYALGGLVVLSFIGIFIAGSKKKIKDIKALDDNIFTEDFKEKATKKKEEVDEEEIFDITESKKKKKK